MGACGGMEVIPKKICIRIEHGVALSAGRNVCQRVFGRRSNDLVEERKDIELDEMQVLVKVEVPQDREGCGQGLVIEDGCRGRWNRGFGRAIEPGRCSNWRDVGNNELRGSDIDKALDIERLRMIALRISSAELAARISLEPPQTANRVLLVISGEVAR